MSRFRIDHLDGPRFDLINGRYYGAGAATMLSFREPMPTVKKPPVEKRKRKRRKAQTR